MSPTRVATEAFVTNDCMTKAWAQAWVKALTKGKGPKLWAKALAKPTRAKALKGALGRALHRKKQGHT